MPSRVELLRAELQRVEHAVQQERYEIARLKVQVALAAAARAKAETDAAITALKDRTALSAVEAIEWAELFAALCRAIEPTVRIQLETVLSGVISQLARSGKAEPVSGGPLISFTKLEFCTKRPQSIVNKLSNQIKTKDGALPEVLLNDGVRYLLVVEDACLLDAIQLFLEAFDAGSSPGEGSECNLVTYEVRNYWDKGDIGLRAVNLILKVDSPALAKLPIAALVDFSHIERKARLKHEMLVEVQLVLASHISLYMHTAVLHHHIRDEMAAGRGKEAYCQALEKEKKDLWIEMDKKAPKELVDALMSKQRVALHPKEVTSAPKAWFASGTASLKQEAAGPFSAYTLPASTPEAFRSLMDKLGVSAEAKVVCLKGYGSGMDAADFKEKMLGLLSDTSVVVWDGDWHKNESFTTVIPDFLAADPSRRAIGFRKAAGNLDGVVKSWSGVVPPSQLAFVLVPTEAVEAAQEELANLGVSQEDIPNTALGWLVVRHTASKFCLAAGGGQTCLLEVSAWLKRRSQGGDSPRWVQLDVGRMTKNGPERPSKELVSIASVLNR